MAEPEKGAMQAVVDGLNPTKGDGLTDKVLPLLGTLAYFTLVGLSVFGHLPDDGPAVVLMGTLGPLVGIWLHRAGQSA